MGLLFTSYTALTAVRELLARQNLPFPVFAAGRKQARVLEQFRTTPGSVLLATGAFWELAAASTKALTAVSSRAK